MRVYINEKGQEAKSKNRERHMNRKEGGVGGGRGTHGGCEQQH